MSDLRPATVGVNSTLIVLSLAAISCRVGRKMTLVRSFGWHDALITLAAFCAVVLSIFQMIITRFGAGLPIALARTQDLKPYFKLVMVSQIFYFICNWSVKHSLLFFYTDLTIDRWPRRSIYAMHAIAFAFGCTCIGATIFQCSPINKMWNDANVDGKCIDVNAFNYFNSCFMLATDLVLYAMPLAFTWNIQLRRPQRIAVNMLFALGGLVLAASGARVYSVNAQAEHPDFTYKFAATMICAVIENHLAIIVACAPSIKVVMLLAFPSLQSKFERMVSRDSMKDGGFRSSAIATMDVEVKGQELGLEENRDVMRPTAAARVVPTEGSCKSHESRVIGKWWRAPSSWHVNTV
ncbi:hypothetical protein EJ02DRAFT_348877 [Clathrospora elynae]|uniref:Rhodopsin domain-containing protein n=1 Tax=Clathrospora elynae TaxID=706981 RepID=A0A6A5SNB1_9PLEO|nr:hypothetical protein EJ02DRAFT_348877 [Clathrospora elynae]